MSLNQDWDITKPVDHTLISDVPDNIRGLKEATKIVFAREHSTPYTGSEGGLHLAGSARAYIDSTVPLTTPDSVALPSAAATTTDNGRLAIVTNGGTNDLKVFVATSSGISTGWQNVKVAYATNAYNVTASSDIDANNYTIDNIKNDTYITAKNAADDGAVDLIKAGRNEADDDDVAVLPESVRIATGIDSDSEDTQVANKGYVDTSISTKAQITQIKEASVSTVVSCSTAMPIDNTIPQNTEGDEVLTVSITPQSATSRLLITFNCTGCNGAIVTSAMALFKDSDAAAIAAGFIAYNGSAPLGGTLIHSMVSGTTDEITFKVRCGSSSGTLRINAYNASGTQAFGGVSMTTLTVMEYTD